MRTEGIFIDITVEYLDEMGRKIVCVLKDAEATKVKGKGYLITGKLEKKRVVAKRKPWRTEKMGSVSEIIMGSRSKLSNKEIEELVLRSGL